MPGAGDGLTVVSAMRHSNPKAITMLLSAFPEMDAAARAILKQTDQVLVKPIEVPALIKAIKQALETGPPSSPRGGNCCSDPATLGEGDHSRVV